MPPWLCSGPTDFATKTPRRGLSLFDVRSRPYYRQVPGMHNREQTMKHFAFVIGALAVGLAVATPARADYAVVRWSDGYCHIWWDASATPWGNGWTKLAIAPD